MKSNAIVTRLLIPRTFNPRRLFIPPSWTRRNYAIQAPGAPTLEVFNQQVKYLQKERAVSKVEESRSVDYLRDEVAHRLCDRLLVCLIFTCV